MVAMMVRGHKMWKSENWKRLLLLLTDEMQNEAKTKNFRS